MQLAERRILPAVIPGFTCSHYASHNPIATTIFLAHCQYQDCPSRRFGSDTEPAYVKQLKDFLFQRNNTFFSFFFLVIFALLIRIGVQIFVDFLRRCSVIFFSSICRFQSFRIVLFSLCVFLMIMVWRTHYSQWTTYIGCIAMHLRGITACISSVSLSVESFILNVLTTPRKMIPIKKLLLGSYGRSLETMIIWDVTSASVKLIGKSESTFIFWDFSVN